MNPTHLETAQRLAARLAQRPDLEAVVIGGSQAAGIATETSDIDIYVYSHAAIPVSERIAIGATFSDHVSVVDYWGPGNEWKDRETGVHVDVIFWTVGWIEEQIDRVLTRHQASLGYTTSLWYTVRVSHSLFDRQGWFSRLQQTASQPYPEALVSAIVRHNRPVLRDLPSSYLKQLEKAAAVGDIVSLNHRAAALLASYFDIVFAANRQPHPGEKRQIAFAQRHCPRLPVNMQDDITWLLHATVNPDSPISQAANTLLDHLDEFLFHEGLLDQG